MDCLYIVPSRGRPANAVRLVRHFNVTSTADARLMIVLDDDDPELNNYRAALNSADMDGLRFSYQVGARERLGPTLNRHAKLYAEHFQTIGFMGDDHLPETAGWDRTLIDEVLRTRGIAYGNDLVHGPGLPTAVLMHASIINALGYMVPPGFIHMYLDNFWRELGTGLNALTYRGDVVIRHVHPIVQAAPWDAGYEEVNGFMGPDGDRWAEYVGSGNLQAAVAKVRAHQAGLTS